jgi:hypothetical protein
VQCSKMHNTRNPLSLPQLLGKHTRGARFPLFKAEAFVFTAELAFSFFDVGKKILCY